MECEGRVTRALWRMMRCGEKTNKTRGHMEELVRQLERHAPHVTFGNDDVKLDEGNAAHLVAALQRVPRVTSVRFLLP